MSPEKGRITRSRSPKPRVVPLKMAGKIDAVDREFFDREIAPHLDGQQIQYLGELSHAQKVSLLGNARATLFPITWNEPFGLVMIESLCTGTPVMAMNLGSVPEVIAQGKTGMICQSVAEMISALPQVIQLNRQDCREAVLSHFSVTQMVNRYETVPIKQLWIGPSRVTVPFTSCNC
uniref:Glycosyltransferase n=1 Tax=Desertifilum tharense IPPAS B-1220 TaxID=1781255 RepID=A0ACD5H0N8_9CYAN